VEKGIHGYQGGARHADNLLGKVNMKTLFHIIFLPGKGYIPDL
jgi:hypothetical protein